MEFYLKEAFQSLKLLEDDFNLTADQGVIDELQSFVADDIEAPAEEEIIDVEADEVEDLQDNYIGKVILECDCCHTRIYKDIADVIIDDESGLANIDEQCPVCSNAFGWNVIGKIEPFKEGEFDDKPEEVEDAEEVPEITDDEIDEALKEALGKTRIVEGVVKDVKMLVSQYLQDEVFEMSDNLALKIHDAIPEYDPDWCNDDMSNKIADRNMIAEDEWLGSMIDSLFAHAPVEESLEEACEKNEECEGKECDESCEKDEALEEEFEDPDKVGLDPDTSVEDDQKLEEPFENPIEEDPKIALAEELKEEEPEKEEALEEDIEEVQSEDAEKLIDPEEEPVLDESVEKQTTKPLTEELSEVEVHTDEGSVSVEKEGPKVVVDFGGGEEEDVIAEPEDEMIAPLDAEEINFIDNNEEQSAEDAALEDEFEAPAEDEFDIDEFDEESFDEIGESYLHRVYDNVDSFKTSKATYTGGKLMVEGLITFKSGKSKATSFVFEGFRNTKRGKVLAEGMNETFSRSNRAFILKGTLNKKNFVCESLTYNYTVKSLNESNESEVVRVYGRAVKK